MGVLAAQKSHMVHTGQIDVVEKAAVAFDQRDRFVGQHRRTDRFLIDEARVRHHAISCFFEACASRATASTESTMA